MVNTITNYVLFAFVATLLLACGGGNAPVDASPNSGPIASELDASNNTQDGFNTPAQDNTNQNASGSDANKSHTADMEFRGKFLIGQTELAWSNLAIENLAAYNIRRAVTAITDYRIGELIYRGRSSQFIDSSPPKADEVHYRLFLEFNDGTVSASDTINLRTLTTINDEPPQAISNLEFFNNGDSLTLAWDNPLDPDLQTIELFRGVAAPADTSASPYRVFDALTSAFTDSNVAPDSEYFYSFIAEDSLANRSEVFSQSFVFEDTEAPQPPRIFESLSDVDSISLSWLPSTSEDVQHYAVLRNSSRFLSYAESLPENTITTEALSWLDSGLDLQNTYRYSLFAVDTSGNASNAVQLSAQTLSVQRPDAPKNFSQQKLPTDNDGSFYLSWTLANPELTGAPAANSLMLVWSNEGFLSTPATADVEQSKALPITQNSLELALTAGEEYFFSLFAMSGEDESKVASIAATLSGFASDNQPPPAASQFNAVASQQGIELTWQSVTETEPYDVVIRYSQEQVPQDLNDGQLLTRQAATLNSVTHRNVLPEQTYYYALFTIDSNNNTNVAAALSQQATALAEEFVDELVNLQATPGDGEIRFSWDALTNASTRVYIQNSIDPNVELDSGLMNEFFIDNEQEFIHQNLANGVQQNYWLYTEDTSTEIRSEVIHFALTPADNLPPLQVQNVRAEPSKSSIRLYWDESQLTDARQVIICMATDRAPTNSSNGQQVYNHEPGRMASFNVDGLKENTRYYFSFFTLDEQNNESHPISLYATTVDTQAPLKPLGLSAQAGDGLIVLQWDQPSDADVASVAISRNPSPDNDPEDEAVFAVNAATRYFKDSTAVNGQAYSYAVRFVDLAGLSSQPSSVTATAIDTTPPPKVQNLNANGIDNQVDLQWQNPILSDASRLIIRYQKGSVAATEPSLEENAIELIPPLPEQASISNLTNDQAYSFSLFALDSAGNYSGFESVTAKPRSTAPSPPASEFTATAEDALIRLQWVNPPSNYTSINIFRSTQSFDHALAAGDLVSGAAFSPGTSNYTDTGLPNGRTYYYALVNSGDNDDSIAVFASAIPVDQTEPFPITGLTATPSDQQVAFSWLDPNDDDLSHILVRRGELDFPLSPLDGVLVDEVARGVEQVTDTGLANDDIYFYAFFAVDLNGYSSQRVTLAVAARDTIAPAPVSNASVTHNNAAVQLNWQNPTDSDLSRIVIRRATDTFPLTATSGFSVASLDSGGGSIPQSFTDSGLTNDTTYYYSLFALDANNNASSATTLTGQPADIEAPPPIFGLITTPLDGQVQFSWTNPASIDFDRLVLLRRQDNFPDSFDDGAATLVFEGTGTAVTDSSGITNGTLYKYRFFILDQYNNASTVDVETGPIDLTPPQLPVCTACSHGDESISLSWSDPPDADLLHIHVRRSTSSPPLSLTDGTPFVPVPPGVQSFVDTGLSNGTPYFYALFSEDVHGNVSSAYAIPTLTPADETPPATPSDTTVSSTETSVTLSWTNPSDGDFTKVIIRRADSAFPAVDQGTLIAELSNGEQSYEDFGVNAGEDYYYSLFAYDEPEANNASIGANLLGQPRDVTAPPPITGQSAIGLDARIDLSWVNPVHPDFSRVLILRKQGSYPADPLDASATVIYDGDQQNHVDIDSLTNFTDYYYRFFSLDAFDNYVSSDLIANPIDLTPPGLVSCSSCIGGDEIASLTWTIPIDSDLAAVRIRRSTTGYPADKDSGDVVADLLLGETNYTDTGLTNDIDYYYAIFSEDDSGNVSAAYQVPVITPVDDTLPAAVNNLTTTSINQRITLYWDNPGDDTVKVYIRRDTSAFPASHTSATNVGEVFITGSNDGYDDTGVIVNTPYYYSLFSEDEAGNISAAATLLVTPVDQTAPADATAFTASKGDYEIDLAWTNATDPDFDAVKIYRRTGSALPTVNPSYLIATLNSGETSYTDTGRSAYTQYSYRITSVDNLGNESLGVTASAYTDYATIADVSLVLTMEKDGKTFLQWQPSTHVHYSHVEVRRSTGPAPTNLSEGDLVYSGTNTLVEDSGLTNGISYNYTLFTIEDDADVTNGTQITLTPLASGLLEYQGPVNFDGNGAGQASALEHFYIGGSPEIRLLVGAKNTSTASFSSLTALDYNGEQYSTRHYAWGASLQKVNDIAFNGYWFAAGSLFDSGNSNDDFALWKIYSSLSTTYSSMNFDTGSASFDDEATNTSIYSGNYFSSGYRDIAGTRYPVVWRSDYYTNLQIGFSSGSWTIPTAANEGYVVDHIHLSSNQYLFAIESTTGSDSVVMASLSSSTGSLISSFDGDGERLIADDEITSLSRASSGETSVSFPVYVSSIDGNNAKIYALQSDGSLLSSFGSSGIVTLTSGLGPLRIEDMVVETDGTLHAIGSLDDGTDLDIHYWRLATDGSVEQSTRLTNGEIGSPGFNNQWPNRILLDQFTEQVIFTGTGFDGTTGYEILFGRISND